MAKPELTEEAQRLRQFLEHIKLKSIDLAAELSIERSFISKYLNGALHIPISLIKHLHIKYNLSYQWFFNGVGRKQINVKEERTLITDMGNILASVGAMEAQIEMLNKKVMKLTRDLYAK